MERVRAWVEFRLVETSLRDLAEEVGVAKSSVDKFVKGESLPGKNWPKLRYWFLRDRRARSATLQDAGEMALLVLEALQNVPTARRRDAIVRTVEHFEAVHRDTFAPRPAWIEALHGLADTHAEIAPPEPPARKRRGRGRRSEPE